ncbi:MAG: hypothetical protein GXO47_02235 [Chlorobi bacterium]|nr:hypothetical protein [Chlorobiota bacterium]
MRRIVFTSVLLINFLISAFTQEHLPTKADYDAFYNTLTLVVLDANPMSDFNFKIKEIMKKDWTLTDYEFISEKEFETKKDDPAYSFLLITTATFDKDKTKARYNFLSLLMGKEQTEVRDMPDLCSVPLSYYRVEDDSYSYKLDAFIRFIQNHVKLMTENPNLIKANVFKYYNKNIKSLKDKKLLLVADDLEPTINTQKKIQKIYPYDVQIVSREEVMNAIERKDPDVVFLHKVGPEGTRYKARCYKILMGAADANFYYFDYHMINSKNRDYLLAKDLKKMAGH